MGARRIAQQAIIFNEKGEVLALKWSDQYSETVKGKYTLPGGTLEEFDKDCLSGLVREVFEETRLKTEPICPVSAGFFTNFDGSKRILVLYLCKTNNYSIMLSPEHSEYKWISLSDLESVDWLNDQCVPAIRRGFELSELLKRDTVK